MSNVKGWRTVGIGFVIAVGPAALTYLGGVDWSHLVPTWAATMISGGIMIGMRLITSTPPGQSS